MKASGNSALRALAGLSILSTLALAGQAFGADDKDASGRLITWTVTRDGKDVLGSESLRIVEGDSGNWFASGELHLKSGKKVHRKSHLQKDGGGKLLKYQRVEAGMKGAGVRLFEWQGQMRVAPINASGKPADVGALASARIWDEGLWHLYQTWGLPRGCDGAKLAYFDPGKKAAGEATLTCVGSRKVYDDKNKAVDVHQFTVGGVGGDAVELWVDGKGDLIGVKSAARMMLRAKFGLEPGKDKPGDAAEDDTDRETIKDRGVGE